MNNMYNVQETQQEVDLCSKFEIHHDSSQIVQKDNAAEYIFSLDHRLQSRTSDLFLLGKGFAVCAVKDKNTVLALIKIDMIWPPTPTTFNPLSTLRTSSTFTGLTFSRGLKLPSSDLRILDRLEISALLSFMASHCHK